VAGFTIGASLAVLRELLQRKHGAMKSAKLEKLIALAEKPKWLATACELRNLSQHPSKVERDKMQRVLEAFSTEAGDA
jgi:hypothetical protein